MQASSFPPIACPLQCKWALLSTLCIVLVSCGDSVPFPEASPSACASGLVAETLRCVAPDTLVADESLLTIAPAQPRRDRIHVVVEIPAGTVEKWEVTKPHGTLALESHNGHPRRIQYLPYPVTYGMIPNTRSSRASGGDGDPLDVFLLGPAYPRGTVVEARAIGALYMQDDGEADDKILAVPTDSSRAPFAEVTNVDALSEQYPGVLSILRTWLTHYEGPGNVVVGIGSAADARALVDSAALHPRQLRPPAATGS